MVPGPLGCRPQQLIMLMPSGGALDTAYTNPFAVVNNREYRAPGK